MIARMWRGWARTQDADEIEFVSVTLFDDLDAIQTFAGDNFDLAAVADHARRVLVRFDERVTHYDVPVELLP